MKKKSLKRGRGKDQEELQRAPRQGTNGEKERKERKNKSKAEVKLNHQKTNLIQHAPPSNHEPKHHHPEDHSLPLPYHL